MPEFPHDMHTHTVYSDGTGSVGDSVAAAEEKGLRVLGITDHSHYLLGRAFSRYIRDIQRWKDEADVTVLAGVEANVTRSGLDVAGGITERLDYVIASVHLWLDDPEEYVELVKAALLDESVDIIGHFGASFQYIGYPSEESIEELLELAEEKGKAFEISSRYRVPERDFIRECIKRGIKLTFASDAHRPADIGRVSWSEKVFLKAGGKKEDLFFGEFL